MKLTINQQQGQIDIGLFEDDKLLRFHLCDEPNKIVPFVKDHKIDQAIVSGDGDTKEIVAALSDLQIACQALDPANFPQLINDQARPVIQSTTIANIFGALYYFPLNDCIIANIRLDTIEFDYISKQGVYLGGAMITGMKIVEATPSALLGIERLEQEKIGNYYGFLGAVERVVSELRRSSETPSGVMTVATGATTLSESVQTELEEFIDRVDPHLTLMGLNQILKERGQR